MRSLSRLIKAERVQRSGIWPVEAPTEREEGLFTPPPAPVSEEPFEATAEDIVAVARKEADRLRAAAREEGRTQGRREGLEEVRPQAREILAQALAIREEGERERAQLLREARTELARVALTVARQVVHQELAIEPEVVVGMVGEALRRAQGAGELTVRVSGADLPILQGHRQALLTYAGDARSLNLVEDGELEPGSAVVEGAGGNVDARVGRMLAVLEQAALKAVEEDA
jgi:flagellar assembly protein FliH